MLLRLALWSVLETGQTFLTGYALARALDDGFLAGRAAVGFGWLGGAGLGVVVAAYGTGRVFRAVADLVEPLRDTLVRQVVGRGLREADGASVSRLTQQVEIARDTFAGLVLVSRSFVFTAAGALIGLFSLAPLLLLVVAPPLLAGIALFAASLRPLARRQERFLVADEEIAAQLGSVAPGLRDISAAGAEREVAGDLDRAVAAEYGAAGALARWGILRTAALVTGGQLPLVLLLVTAPWLLDRGVTPGALVGAIAYVTQALLPALNNLIHGLGTSGSRLAIVLRRLTWTPPPTPAGDAGSSAPSATAAEPPPTPEPPTAPGGHPTPAGGDGTASHAVWPTACAADPAPTGRPAPEPPTARGGLPTPVVGGGTASDAGWPAACDADPAPTGRPAPEPPTAPGGHPTPVGGGGTASDAGRLAACDAEPVPTGRPAPEPPTAPGGHPTPAGGDGTASHAVRPAACDAEPVGGDRRTSVAPTAAGGRPAPALQLSSVSFAYGPFAEPVVRDLSLTVPRGGHLAVVGPSGIGKSTLVGLVAGMLQAGSGVVRVDGRGVRGPEAVGRRVLIPQEAYVFSGTVRENLAYLREDAVGDAELIAAAGAVGLGGVIERLGGLDAPVDPAALSAGERQLVALTRAHVSHAPLALLDEATCHLDPAAEARAERAFAARPGGTLVVIAHRISSARRADRILVMDGTHTLCGSHGELLRSSSLYRELCGSWSPANGANGANGADGTSYPALHPRDPYRVDPVAGPGLAGDGGHVVAHRPVGQMQSVRDLGDGRAPGGEREDQ
ncbi:ATP-binding cassette domain-containing protein [Streptomyces sp. NPDC046925]|uniref:ATP-binding cassette domain-containing protein n=1 Tax=Streptomyces sp. NPDC046925 TaxID=3155375 RepID=UPI0033C9CFFD